MVISLLEDLGYVTVELLLAEERSPDEQDSPLVLALDDASAILERVGGKGSSLARLAAAGLPVPPGFHITTTAYRLFVARHGLQEQILVHGLSRNGGY